MHSFPDSLSDRPTGAEALVARLQVALLQFDAGRRRDDNLSRLKDWMATAPPADLLAVPEVVSLRGSDDDLRRAAEPLDGPCIAFFRAWAQRHAVWILVGSILEQDGPSVYNTSVLLDRRGAIAAVYRKIHLFEAHLPDGKVIREQDVYQPGTAPVMVTIDGWPAGLSICYDIRFPELYRGYAAAGACLLMIPANFTQRTGRDHWEILLRARAIENQCFVIAPNQCGINSATGIASYGHSMVIGPWGEVLVRAGETEQWLSATLDHAAMLAVRQRIPALDHRRLIR